MVVGGSARSPAARAPAAGGANLAPIGLAGPISGRAGDARGGAGRGVPRGRAGAGGAAAGGAAVGRSVGRSVGLSVGGAGLFWRGQAAGRARSLQPGPLGLAGIP